MNGLRVSLTVAAVIAAGVMTAAAPAAAAEPVKVAGERHADIDWFEAAANHNAKRCHQRGQMYVEVFYAVNLESTAAKIGIKVKGKKVAGFTDKVSNMERGWLAGDQDGESYSDGWTGCVRAGKRSDVKVTLTAVGGSRTVSNTIKANDRIWGC